MNLFTDIFEKLFENFKKFLWFIWYYNNAYWAAHLIAASAGGFILFHFNFHKNLIYGTERQFDKTRWKWTNIWCLSCKKCILKSTITENVFAAFADWYKFIKWRWYWFTSLCSDHSDITCAKILINNGTGVDLIDRRRCLPIDYAYFMDNLQLRKYLIKHSQSTEKKQQKSKILMATFVGVKAMY